jgi:hypothetical protein
MKSGLQSLNFKAAGYYSFAQDEAVFRVVWRLLQFVLQLILNDLGICFLDWKTHGSEYYECSRYKENPNIANESAHAQAREALKKYIFYFERVSRIRLSSILIDCLFDFRPAFLFLFK